MIILTFPAFSQVWNEFATMEVRGSKVTLYGDRTSLRIDEQNDDERRLWVKFELSEDMQSEYNKEKYRIRKEEYFFRCDENEFAVAHTILMDEKENIVYDSGYHHPFDPAYEENWYQVTPGSGPEIIYNSVCKLGEGKKQVADESVKDDDSKETTSKTSERLKGFKTSGHITGGEITDGLDVKEVRWAPRKGFERLVFDVYKWGGYEKPEGTEPVEVPGYFEVSMSKDENKMEIRLGGYRSFSAELPELNDSKLIESITINKNEKLADDSGYILDVVLKRSSAFKAFELHKPARIVIDLIPEQDNP